MTKTAIKAVPTPQDQTAGDEGDIRREMLRLVDLILSPLNPRQSVTEIEVISLAQSIKQIGLMQNLAGYRRPDGTVEIVAGGRRLRALEANAAADDVDTASVMVPVIVTEDAAEAQAWASTENVARKPLHPADEVNAFAAMDRTGMAVPEIANAFGVTVRHVKGRMKLASLPAAILEALRSNEITLDVAAAYTVANDEAHALEVFEAMKRDWRSDRPEQIKSLLTGNDFSKRRLIAFVGRQRYEAEGGEVIEDLFGEDVFFPDDALLTKLAMERLEGEKAMHMAAGWKWVQVSLDRPSYEETSAMGRTYAQDAELSDEDAERYDDLADLVDGDSASEAEQAEFDALQAKLERQDFTIEQMDHAGVILWVGQNGDIGSEYGLIRTEDREAAEDAGICRPSQHGVRVQAAEEKKGPYSAALESDLAEVRTAAVQTAMLDNPQLALDLLTFALTTSTYGGVMPLGLSTETARNCPAKDDGLRLPKALKPGTGHSLPLSGETASTAFAKFQRKKPGTKARALTEAIARLFSTGLASDRANPLAEMIAADTKADIRKVWTPTGSFLARLKGPQLDAIMAEILGEPAPQSFTKLKKGEKVKRLDGIFTNAKGMPPLSAEQRKRADAWVPEGVAEAPKADAADQST